MIVGDHSIHSKIPFCPLQMRLSHAPYPCRPHLVSGAHVWAEWLHKQGENCGEIHENFARHANIPLHDRSVSRGQKWAFTMATSLLPSRSPRWGQIKMATSPLPCQGPQGGEMNMATSPLPSWGPHGGGKSIWLHHPCLLGVPMVGRDQYGYITPAFWGYSWWGEINMAA